MPKLRYITFLLLVSCSGFAQSRAPYFNLHAKIILPQNYSSDKTYPLLIMLPYTTGTAEEFYNRYRNEIGTDRYIVLLPEGRPVRIDYLPNFMQYVDWYEERLLEEIHRAERLYSVDTSKRILTGYSLGGDLSWALTMKQPDMFIGAIMAGTRCSYAPERSDLEILDKNGYRGVFFIGRNEDINRYDGINAARWTLDNAGIETQYTEIEGGHVAAPEDMFGDALNWILNGDNERDGGTNGSDNKTKQGELTLRLVNNSGKIVVSVDLQPAGTQGIVPLMGTYMGDEALKPGEEISFELSKGDVIYIEGEMGYSAESPSVEEDMLMILQANGSIRLYK